MRERERQKEREKERERQKERERERQRQNKKERERERNTRAEAKEASYIRVRLCNAYRIETKSNIVELCVPSVQYLQISLLPVTVKNWATPHFTESCMHVCMGVCQSSRVCMGVCRHRDTKLSDALHLDSPPPPYHDPSPHSNS